jgi:hypothetical protein
MTDIAELKDRILICTGCGERFTWTAAEQAFFREKGLTGEPKHCKECRRANIQRRAERGSREGENK